MSANYDIIIIGAGPAGMAASKVSAKYGASVLVIDEQRSPGGQIYRAIEDQINQNRPELGETFRDGFDLVKAFRASGADYVTSASVWQLSSDLEVGYSKDGSARMVSGKQIILANGAQERPMPVPGWTLPGVMTVGAAQILLKESQIGIENAVFAGTGPLLYLAVHQYLQAGIPIKAVLDMTQARNYVSAALHLPWALGKLGKLVEGWRWTREIAKSNIPFFKGVDDIRIGGEDAVTHLEFRRDGKWTWADCEHVLLHQGVVPSINLALAAGCAHSWDWLQCCWIIDTDDWCSSSVPGIAVAGDGATIGGNAAAEHSGQIAALGALEKIGLLDARTRDESSKPIRKLLKAEMRARPFLETLFRPAEHMRIPQSDTTIVCRCEEITAGDIRETVAIGCSGPNQLKSYCRCGMGPCQGRLCGLTVSELIAETTGRSVTEVGYYRLRSPVKPLRLEELANLKTGTEG